jgi:hypothetical protein
LRWFCAALILCRDVSGRDVSEMETHVAHSERNGEARTGIHVSRQPTSVTPQSGYGVREICLLSRFHGAWESTRLTCVAPHSSHKKSAQMTARFFHPDAASFSFTQPPSNSGPREC